MDHPRRAVSRDRLDARFASMKPSERYRPPTKGWIRAIRDALEMSGAQLGQRLGVKAQSVVDLEKSEMQGTIQLKTLRRAAEALDCVLIYALVPKSSLNEMVEEKTREIARKELARISHTMDLEAQGLSAAEREAQIDAYIRDHLKTRDPLGTGVSDLFDEPDDATPLELSEREGLLQTWTVRSTASMTTSAASFFLPAQGAAISLLYSAAR